MEINESLIGQFEELVKEHVDTAIQHLRSKELDLGAVYAKDARDFQEVLNHYRAGDFDRAIEKADSLDTAARDNIPQEFWEINKRSSSYSM